LREGNPSQYNRVTSYGAAKYVKNLEFDPKTGEILTSNHKPIFDETKLREEEKWDGYYAIVTSELNRTDDEIIEIYRGLWRIEESFKVTKSDLEARPVYVTREDHIQAHFLICFIALVILRLLQKRLDNEFSISQIVNSLSKTQCVHMKENHYLLCYRDTVIDSLKQKMDIDLTRKVMRFGDLKNIFSNAKKKLFYASVICRILNPCIPCQKRVARVFSAFLLLKSGCKTKKINCQEKVCGELRLFFALCH
jgi:hypothetical protein